MIHYFIGEAEGVCGASVPGFVATQCDYVWPVMFGLAGLIIGVPSMTVIVMRYGAPP